ncbi:hypothetical protein [Neobacillus niacini]|uniref:hypothetical protein n=1 Tax=Neobacillus niacini TaxID=86668 RepID=UPI0005EF5CC1|nr:hypothetical protein [Neobacillus niacini]
MGKNASQKMIEPETISSTIKVRKFGFRDIYALATIVPGVVYLLIFVVLIFLYPLTKQRMKQLTIDLTEQRKTRK